VIQYVPSVEPENVGMDMQGGESAVNMSTDSTWTSTGASMSQTSTQYGYPAEEEDEEAAVDDIEDVPDDGDEDQDDDMHEEEGMQDDDDGSDQVVSPFVFSSDVLGRVRAEAVVMNQRATLGLSLVAQSDEGHLNTDEIMAVLP